MAKPTPASNANFIFILSFGWPFTSLKRQPPQKVARPDDLAAALLRLAKSVILTPNASNRHATMMSLFVVLV
jgi:hypothetical protein